MIQREQHTILTEDAISLAATSFVPRGTRPERVAILLCATGATQERFEPFARYLAGAGWAVVTFDYRSIGRSVLPAHARATASMRAWGEKDLTAVIRWVDGVFSPRRLVAVGHSIGGQLLPLSPESRRLDAALLVSAQRGYWGHWRGWQRYGVLLFFSVFVPVCLRLFGRVPMAFMGLDDLQRGVAEDYARWGLKPDYLGPAGEPLLPLFAACTFPLLALSFEDDLTYAPRKAVETLLHGCYTSAPAAWCHIEHTRLGMKGLGHSGFFEPERCPRAWWDEVASWLATATPASCMPGRREGAGGLPSLGDLAIKVARPAPQVQPPEAEAGATAALGGR
jgi:predicted alpha/beta hydrolase